jgi:cell division protein ZapA
MKVQIFEQTYSVSGNFDSGYIQGLAKIVDAKMREIARATGTVDSTKVAVLAALSIADELHALRQSTEEKSGVLRDRAERCIELIDRVLQQSS